MSTNIKRAKKELQQEMTEASTWTWPQTQKRYKRECVAESEGALIGYGSLKELEELDPSQVCGWDMFKPQGRKG
eukprot:7240010-Prorocentrum_lima.AAC.1